MIGFDRLSLVGRLGNALFQLAATAGVADQRGEPVRFNAGWIHRPFLSVPDELFTDDFTGVTQLENCRELGHIDERVRVYAQDVSLFEPILPQLREWLAPSPAAKKILARMQHFDRLPRPILSVHVRRGDNVYDPGVPDKHNYFVLPSLDYYRRAIAELRPRFNSVAVFSDDPGWCQAHLADVADYFHVGEPRPKEHEPTYRTAPVLDWIDLQLMSRCHGHVVTGSTFGVMAAILAGQSEVIRCSPVYGRKLRYIDEALMFPKHWKVVRL